MHSKNNRVNHDFQIAYFLAGACHTPDGAYALLRDLQEDREMALSQLEALSLREQAKIEKAKFMISEGTTWEQLEAKADLAEIENNKKFTERNIAAAYAELEFINKCIEKLQPHRKFAHLTDAESHEATQHDEWKLEFISRAENFLITTGSIPTDEFASMRMHPAFEEQILPYIEDMRKSIESGENVSSLVNKLNQEKINIPLLINSKG